VQAGIADELVELVRKNEELLAAADKVPALTAKLLQTESRLDSVMQMCVIIASNVTNVANDARTYTHVVCYHGDVGAHALVAVVVCADGVVLHSTHTC
jgi:uncharacterized protein with PhoU and TrkA domain